MTEKIDKVLIVGYGSMGRRYANLLNHNFPEIEIKILRHRLTNKNIDTKIDTQFLFTIEDALNFNPNAAIVANPASHHLEISNILAKKNVHLLIEKPIGSSSKGFDKFLSYCNQNKIIVMTAYNLRFSSSLNEFRNILKREKIGKILSIHAEVGQYLPNWRDSDYRFSVSAQKELGGGVLLELSHEIDYISWIFGKFDWVKADLTTQSDLDIDVEDNANIIFGILSKSNYQIPGSLKMDFFRHDTTRYCKVIGNNGTLLWNGIKGEVSLFSKNATNWELLYSKLPHEEETYLNEIRHFFSSIKNSTSPLISGKDGLNSVIVVEAIQKSSIKNKTVNLKFL